MDPTNVAKKEFEENPAARAKGKPRVRFRFNLEAVGEIILLAVVGAFFVYLFVQSLEWTLGAALMPRIAVIIGAPFWGYRLLVLFFKATEAETSDRIMDIGFRTGADPTGERSRFVRICAFIVGLYLGIWLLGFHIALPIGMIFYVRVYGGVSWAWSLTVGVLFLALLVGVYDRLLNAFWHEPPLLQWIYSFFPEPQ